MPTAPPRTRPMSGPELDAYAELRTARPDLAERFAGLLPEARAGILAKLCGALWREGLPGTRRDGDALVLDDGRRLTAPAAATEPFGRPGPDLAVTVTAPDGRTDAVRDPVDLLALLPAFCARVAAELAGSVANLALALTAARHGTGHGTGTGHGSGMVAGWPASPLVVAEQGLVEGHPLHPCCRARGGFTPADVLAYAPEWANPVPLLVVAVPRARAFVRGRRDLSALLCAEHPDLAGAADPDRHLLLPVHPWQFQHVLRPRYRLAALSGVRIPAHPLMSLRTFAPAADPAACHLKTALDVQVTSAVRTVSPAAVHNGPALSTLLAEIAEREGGFGGRFAVLAEHAAGAYVTGDGPARDLAAIARQSPEAGLGPGEQVLPLAALAGRAGGDGEWFATLCKLTVPPLLTLLTRWGVALEAHGQNTLVVLRHGQPYRVLYRDFGGVRVSPRRLAAQGIAPPDLAGDVPTDDPVALRTKLAGSLLTTALAGLVAGSPDPRALWHEVAATVRDTYARTDLAGEPAAAEDRAALFAPTLPQKALLSMRLAGGPPRDRWVPVPNPLAAA